MPHDNLIPMSLRAILSVVQIAAVLAYLGLAVRLWRSGRWLPLRFFFAYCCLMVVDLIWHPLTVREAMWIEPWLLSLRLMAVLEAISLATDQIAANQRRYMLLFLIFAGATASARVAGYFDVSTMAGWYRAVAQCVHVGLAAACIAGNLYERIGDMRMDPVLLPHLRILSLYMVGRALVSFYNPGKGLAAHSILRIEWLLFVCAWSAVWLFYDRRELRAPRLQRLNASL